MDTDDKILGIHSLIYYKAPKGRLPRPILIKRAVEYIELITSGSVYFDDEGERMLCHSGTLFWHLPNESTVYKSNLDEPYECLAVVFDMAPPFKRIAPRRTFWSANEAKAFANEALRAFHNPAIDRKLLAHYVHSRLLWAACNSSIGGADNALEAQELPPPLAKALALIDIAYHTPLEVSDLAKEAGVTEAHLHLLFRKHTGSTPHKCLAERRIQEAKRLLVNSNLSLKTVAFNCGFKSVEHFCRVFKLRFNSTASELRRNETPDSVLEIHPTLKSQRLV